MVSIYCTGLGAVSPAVVPGSSAPLPPPRTIAQVGVSIGGIPAIVTYAGLASGLVGVYQVNAQVPARALTGDQLLQISANGSISNVVTIAIQ
ncbi:MAG TPA: hypothetical protein VKV15_12910 [Bryobacteraceae bacterium]|nr:hypothetical protein [Bryobacteraceae bacterium]